MNKTVISFAKKYNLKYTESKYMYGLTGYVTAIKSFLGSFTQSIKRIDGKI